MRRVPQRELPSHLENRPVHPRLRDTRALSAPDTPARALPRPGRRHVYPVTMQPPRPYPSDLSDARWELIRPTLEAWRQARNGIRKPTHDLRSPDERHPLRRPHRDPLALPAPRLPAPRRPSTATSPHWQKPTASSTSSTASSRRLVREAEGRTSRAERLHHRRPERQDLRQRPRCQPGHRRRQEDRRPQTAHRHRHTRPPAGRRWSPPPTSPTTSVASTCFSEIAHRRTRTSARHGPTRATRTKDHRTRRPPRHRRRSRPPGPAANRRGSSVRSRDGGSSNAPSAGSCTTVVSPATTRPIRTAPKP